MPPAHERKRAAAFLFVLAFASFLFLFKLGDRPLRNPDEGRYAEIAKEMVETGDWVEPRLYGIDYLRKPPLLYWLVAGSFKVFGFTEFAARLVPALFGILGVAAGFWFAREVFGLKSAFFAALMLAANAWYLQVGRYLLIDMVFTFFTVAGLYCFYLAAEKGRTAPALFFYVCAAMAFLSKGVVALVIPGISILAYLLALRRARAVWPRMRPGWGIAIFLFLTLPWFVAVAKRQPEFLKFFFYHEHLKRFVSAQFEHQESWYFYLWVIPAVFMPWTLFFEPLRKAFSFPADAARPARFFLLIASAGIVFFYSLSRTKLPTYILPAVPLLTILLADGWCRWETAGMNAARRWAAAPLFLLLFVAFAALIGAGRVNYLGEPLTPGIIFQIRLLAGILIASSAAGLKAVRAGSVRRLFLSMLLALGAGSIPVFFLMKAVSADYTTRPFAESLRARLRPGDEVFIYDQPGAFYDFRFYLNAPVKLAGLEGELKLAPDGGEAGKIAVPKDRFKKMLAGGGKIYCLMRQSDFSELEPALRARLRVMSEDRRKVLVESP